MNTTLEKLFNEFVSECEHARKVRPTTIYNYKKVFELFLKLNPDLTPQLLTSATVVQFFKVLNERERVVGKRKIRTGIKKSTVATYWGKLSGFFQWLKVNGHIEKNPLSDIKHPAPLYEERKFLRRGDIEKILTAILKNPSGTSFLLKRNLVIFHLLLFCGLRKQELILLQLRDIDLERKVVTIQAGTTKVGRTRYVPLHSHVVYYLEDYLHERRKYTSPYLLVSSTRDDRLSDDGLKHLVTSLKETSGINFHLHQFRHTFAVNFLKKSNDVVKLQQLLGHTDIHMTMIYLRCLPTKEMKQNIESMRIDEFV